MFTSKKWTVSAAAVALLAVTGLAGCGGKTQPAPAAADNKAGGQAAKSDALPPVKLRWVVRASPQKDQQKVFDAVNQITKSKIYAEVQIDFIDPGAPYDQKVKTMLAANENYDVMFTGAPSAYGDFYGKVAKGAFLPITDLLPKYAPQTYASIPKNFWNAVEVNKQIYGIPNYQIVARQNGIIVQKAMLDKYNFSLDSVKKLEDLEPLLAKMKAGEPKNKVPFLLGKTGGWETNYLVYRGLDPVGPASTVGMIHLNDGSMKVINQFEDQGLRTRSS